MENRRPEVSDSGPDFTLVAQVVQYIELLQQSLPLRNCLIALSL